MGIPFLSIISYQCRIDRKGIPPALGRGNTLPIYTTLIRITHGYVQMGGTKYISHVYDFCAHVHGPRTGTRTYISVQIGDLLKTHQGEG